MKDLAESAVGKIKSLNDTKASILRNKTALEAERDRLLRELSKVNQAIDTADHDFSQIPLAITRLEGEKQEHVSRAYCTVTSSTVKTFSNVLYCNLQYFFDQIRLRAIKVIQEALGLL